MWRSRQALFNFWPAPVKTAMTRAEKMVGLKMVTAFILILMVADFPIAVRGKADENGNIPHLPRESPGPKSPPKPQAPPPDMCYVKVVRSGYHNFGEVKLRIFDFPNYRLLSEYKGGQGTQFRIPKDKLVGQFPRTRMVI